MILSHEIVCPQVKPPLLCRAELEFGGKASNLGSWDCSYNSQAIWDEIDGFGWLCLASCSSLITIFSTSRTHNKFTFGRIHPLVPCYVPLPASSCAFRFIQFRNISSP